MGQGIDRYGSMYSLDGKPTVDPGSERKNPPAGLVATNAVASLAATDKQRRQLFVEALWNERIPDGQGRYYDGMLYLLSLLHVSGQFRIWSPQQAN